MNILCDVCLIDCNSVKGAYLLDGDATDTLSFLCPHCYKLSSKYMDYSSMEYSSTTDVFIDYILKQKEGQKALKIYDDLVGGWNNLESEVIALVKIYWGYLAGLVDHPLYLESMDTLVTSLIYSVGFPVGNSVTYYPMNMNISTSANSLLYRRSLRVLHRIRMSKSGIDKERTVGYLCEFCLKEDAKIKCSNCKSAYYCSVSCLFGGLKAHILPCGEIVQVDKNFAES